MRYPVPATSWVATTAITLMQMRMNEGPATPAKYTQLRLDCLEEAMVMWELAAEHVSEFREEQDQKDPPDEEDEEDEEVIVPSDSGGPRS